LHKFEINNRLFELTMQIKQWRFRLGPGCGTAKPPVSASTPPLSWQHILLRPESKSDMPF